MNETGHDCVAVSWYTECPICRIDTLLNRVEELEVLVSRGRAQIAVMGGAGDRLTSENAELREKWHSFSKATLGEWAELKKERDTLKEEVAELRESAKRADLWKDRSE